MYKEEIRNRITHLFPYIFEYLLFVFGGRIAIVSLHVVVGSLAVYFSPLKSGEGYVCYYMYVCSCGCMCANLPQIRIRILVNPVHRHQFLRRGAAANHHIFRRK